MSSGRWADLQKTDFCGKANNPQSHSTPLLLDHEICRFCVFAGEEKTFDMRVSNLFGLSSNKSAATFKQLTENIDRRKGSIHMRGKKNLMPRTSCCSVQYKCGAALCVFLEVPKQPVMCGYCQSPAEGPMSPGCAPTTGGVFDLQECVGRWAISSFCFRV